MGLDQFVHDRRPVWSHLAGIVAAAYRRGVRRLPPADVYDMVHLYRDVSADLARLRSLDADPQLVSEVNRLVARAHAQIYRGVRGKSYSVLSFFLVRYPQLFRETWRFTFASFLISALFAGLAYRTVQTHPDLVADVMGPMMASEFRGDKKPSDIKDRFRAVSSPVLSSFVTGNNIMVALKAFALGITFGLGTVYVLLYNGMMVGGIAGAYAKSGIAADLWLTLLPHGALELSAIVVAGGAGLLLGYSLWCPGQRTRRRALREDAIKAGQLAVGLIPAFLVAGFFEGFVTPNDVMPEPFKAGLGVAVAVAFWLYLFLGGRQANAAARSASLRTSSAVSATGID
jgi:uncharacterized membrane protein SpoIIM required for sporulation